MNTWKQMWSHKSLWVFLIKNGLICIIVSFIIVQSLLMMLDIHVNHLSQFPLYILVLFIITVFFLIPLFQERKLRSKQEQLLAVIKNSTKSILVLDKNKNVTSLNEAGRELLGIEDTGSFNFCDVCATYPGADRICDVSTCFLMNDQENPINLYIKNPNHGRIPVQATISFYKTQGNETGTAIALQKVSDEKKDEYKKIEKMITNSIFQAQEKERKLISRELHDGIGQSLFGMLLQVDIIKMISEKKKEEFNSHLEKLQSMITQTIEDVRNLSSELRPSSLDDHGLMATLKNFIRSFGNSFGMQINFTYIGPNEKRLPAAYETALYRIAQEALINAAKYSSAERIDIVLDINQEIREVYLSITDFGKGFEINSTTRNGVGIYSMEERAAILGGEFSIDSEIGLGTQVKVKIPIQ